MCKLDAHRGLALPLLLLVAAAALPGCNSRQFMPVAFRGVELQSIQPDIAQQALTVKMGLKFRYTNPFSFNLPVPRHGYKLFLNNQPNPVFQHETGVFVIPGHGQTDQTYSFTLNLSSQQFQQLLGKDVPYRFTAAFGLPIPGGNQPDRQVRLEHEDSIRLPKFPEVRLASNAAPRIRLLGDVAKLDVKAFRDPMVQVGDLLANNLDGIIDLYLLVNNLLGGRNPSTAERASFKEGWNKFKNDVPNQILVRSNISGLRFELPMSIKNPNQFSIHAPTAVFSLNPSNAPGQSSAISFVALQYTAPDPVIAAGQSMAATLVTEFHWDKLLLDANNNTIIDPLTAFNTLLRNDTKQINLKLRSDTSVDLGYGPVHVPVTLDLSQLKLGQP